MIRTTCTRRTRRRSESDRMAKLKNTLRGAFPRITELDDGRVAIDVEPGTCILWKRDSDHHCSVEVVLTKKQDGPRPVVNIRPEEHDAPTQQ
jgi:hypothetical protein